MTVNGFAMRIIPQCTALHYVIILSVAILLYTRHSIQYRAAGVVVSTILIIAANALRLFITGVIGSISLDAFVIMHDYLWVAAFSLLILGLWIVWAERKISLTANTIKRGGIVLLTCTAVYGVLLLVMPLYGKIMAMIASPLFKVLAGDPGANLIFKGELMIYQYAGGTFTANFATDLMAVALYIGLVLSGGSYRKARFKQGILGFLIIICISASAIAGGGALAVTSGKSIAVVFLWTGHGVLLSLSILLWGMMRRTPEPEEYSRLQQNS